MPQPEARTGRDLGSDAGEHRFGGKRLPRWLVPEMLYVVALGCAVGILIADYALARHTIAQAIFVGYWLAFALAVVSSFGIGLGIGSSKRKTQSRTARPRLSLVLFGAFLFVPKFLMSIGGPIYFDEFGEFRHVLDVLRTGNLFAPISYQPIISDFPGLSAATIAVHEVTRLPPWSSGQIVILVAHSASLVAVYAIAKTVGATKSGSFIAGFVYALNPSYSFFDAQFSYESLGLPLALIGILGCLRCFVTDGVPRTNSRTSRVQRRQLFVDWWPAVGLLALCGATVTHHLSALFADALCILVALTFMVRRVRGRTRQRLLAGSSVAIGGAIATILWLWLVATSIGSYLGPHFGSSVRQILELLGLAATPATPGFQPKRELFAGSQLPGFELGSAFATPFIVLILMVAAGVILWRMRRRRPLVAAAVVPFVLLACAYFVSLPVALTTAGAEIAHRSWGYSYLGIAVVVALTVDRVRLWKPKRVRYAAIVAMVLVVPLAIGNVAVGVNVTYRFPGPYQFGTDSRSGNPELSNVVNWLNAHALPGVGVVTDRFTGEYITAYTRLRVPEPTQIMSLGLFAKPLDPPGEVISALRDGNFQYFVLDEHIFTQIPRTEFYSGAMSFMKIDISGLTQASRSPILRQVYSTENYRVYRILLVAAS